METAYYQLPSEEALLKAGSGWNGLTEEEAKNRMSTFGGNDIPSQKSYSVSGLIIDQLKDAMILILVIAAAIAGFLGEWIDAAIIYTIILINSIVGFFQAYNAEKAIDAIRNMVSITTRVIREGKVIIVEGISLVPGDIVLVEAGNVIPADLRLLESVSLMVDESALTGESVPVMKSTASLAIPELPVADQSNMAFKGTTATHGRAKGLVVQTGSQTEIGKIASMLGRKKRKTPLQLRMESFSKKLSYLILTICVLLFIIGWSRGEQPLPMLLVAVSLAVAAIPEALPALVTIALAKGASRLVKQNTLIRKLPAVETLGSVNTICTDKTGTLTQNKMTLVRSMVSKNNLTREFHLSMALNNDSILQDGKIHGDPTENALLEFLIQENGPDFYHEIRTKYKRIAEIGFTADRKCMTTIHDDGKEGLLFCKGGAEQILRRLSTEIVYDSIQKTVDEWSAEGLRVLAFAYKTLTSHEMVEIDGNISEESLVKFENNLTMIGLAGIADPPRKEVSKAIEECRQAGIRVVMITGDHPETAKSISKEIGLSDCDSILTGYEMKKLSIEQLQNNVMNTSVFARVSPAQKLDIMTALQAKGHFIAMTGDGVNDAPALKASNIGIAMGVTGTDVSKEAADMILLDDNFTTIVKAIREGRRIFDNIRKFVRYIMTCNSAEILTIFLAPLVGLPLPLLPVHILWINLVTDGLPGIALASEKEEPDIMHRPPRPAKESLFAHGSGFHILWVGTLMAGITLLVQAIALSHGSQHWQTMVFTVLSLSQLGHVMAIRSEKQFLYQQGLFSNKPLILAVLVTLVLQLAVIYLPLANKLFKTDPLTMEELFACIAASSIVFHAVEFEKWITKKRTPRLPKF